MDHDDERRRFFRDVLRGVLRSAGAHGLSIEDIRSDVDEVGLYLPGLVRAGRDECRDRRPGAQVRQ